MKATLLQENLVKGIQAVSRLTTTAGQLPILSHLLVRATKEGLLLLGTDLSLSVSLKIGAKVEKEGEIAVPAKLLSEYVGSLTSGKMTLEGEAEQLTVKSGASTARFQGMTTGEFPKVPTSFENHLFTFPAGWEKVVDQVCFAAAIEESRPTLTAVQVKREGEEVRLVATDGYRLSLRTLPVELGAFGKREKEWEKLIPARSLQEVALLRRGFGQEEKVRVGETGDSVQVIFVAGDATITSRLLEGEFPPFEHIIPQKGETEVRFLVSELLAAVRRAAIFARESANIVRWEITSQGVTIEADSPQLGANQTVVEAMVRGGGGKVAFNSRYLLDLLQAVASGEEKQELIFTISGPLAPGLFTLPADKDFKHIIMPVRLQEQAGA